MTTEYEYKGFIIKFEDSWKVYNSNDEYIIREFESDTEAENFIDNYEE